MKKYNSYPKFLSICCLLLSIFGLWSLLGSFLGIIKGDNQDFFVEIICGCLTFSSFWYFLYSSNKIVVTDEYISRKDFLFRERKMYFLDIKRYKTSLFQNEKFLILCSDNFELKIPLYDRNFVVDFSKVLRKLFCEEIENSIQNIKENGILFESFKYKIIINGKGIKNLKTNKEFLWNKIDCRIKKKKKYTSYLFEIDNEIKIDLYKNNFNFADEDFFDEMLKRCRTCII